MNQKQLLAWCDDLHQVKGNISQLQSTLNQILAKAPTFTQYQTLAKFFDEESTNPSQDVQLVDRAKGFLISPQLKIATRIKFLYEKGYLPLLISLTKINFKSPKSDRFVGYLLDYKPPKINVKLLPDPLKRSIGIKNESQIENLTSNYPPTLPPISNQILLKVILTDKSYREPADILMADKNDEFYKFNDNHNSKLSIRGSNLLQFILTEIIDETLVNIHEDDLILLQHKLMAPLILSKLATTYNLVDNLYHNLIVSQASVEDKITAFSKVFLAYIGGLHQDNYSVEEVKMWIRKLYEPIISKLHSTFEVNGNFKNIYELSHYEFLFLTKKVHTSSKLYEFVKISDDPITVQLNIGNGLISATGISLQSFNDAKYRACYEVMTSKSKFNELLKQIIDVKTTAEPSSPPQQKVASPLTEPLMAESSSNDDEDAYSPGIEEDDYEPQFEEPSKVVEPKPAATAPLVPTKAGYYQPVKPKPVAAKPTSSAGTAVTAATPLPYNSLPPNPSFINNTAKQMAPNNGAHTLPSMSNDVALRFPVDHHAKTTLAALLATRQLNATYRNHGVGNDFQTTITVNDMVLGVAYDPVKKTADQKAAMNALSNIKGLQQLGVQPYNQ